MADFQGVPDPDSPFNARICSRIRASVSCRDADVSASIEAVFDPGASWCRNPQTASAALLRHEQVHFDITEVYARQLRQKLIANQLTATGDCEKVRQEFSRDLRETQEEWTEAEARYDRESKHGNDGERQTAWEWHTQKKLAKLQAYAQ